MICRFCKREWSILYDVIVRFCEKGVVVQICVDCIKNLGLGPDIGRG